MKEIPFTIFLLLLWFFLCLVIYDFGYDRGVEYERVLNSNRVHELRIRDISPELEKDCWREAILEFENREAK